MSQATLEFDPRTTRNGDPTGFAIGWDHARHALVPPPALLATDSAIGQGWHAARAVFGRRVLAASRPVRLWLELRLRAWHEGQPYEAVQLTPNHLGQLVVTSCPVTRQPLGGAREGADAPVIVRLNEDAGYAAGNLVMLSRAAAMARAGCSFDVAWQKMQQAERAAAGGEALVDGLDAAAWARLATLISLATALPHARAQRLPLRALPPNRVRLLNAAQGLQALMTLHLAAPGWSQRARRLADALPRQTLRHDFNLLISALAPRLLEALRCDSERARREALEDAWADMRVHRRWQLFMAQLDEAEAERLAGRLARGGIAGRHVLVHEVDAATEGWALPALAPAPARAPLRLLAPRRLGRRAGGAATVAPSLRKALPTAPHPAP